jgi:hypothetical protein
MLAELLFERVQSVPAELGTFVLPEVVGRPKARV